MEITGLAILIKLLKLSPLFIAFYTFFRRNMETFKSDEPKPTFRKMEFIGVGITVALLLFVPIKLTDTRSTNYQRSTFESIPSEQKEFVPSVDQRYTKEKREAAKVEAAEQFESKTK